MKKSLLLTFGLALALSACTTHQIRYKNPTAQAAGPTHSAKQSFYLWGLVGGAEVDLAKLCPTGVASINSKSSGVDAILHWVTGGLYSPMSVAVQCSGGGGAVATGGAQ